MIAADLAQSRPAVPPSPVINRHLLQSHPTFCHAVVAAVIPSSIVELHTRISPGAGGRAGGRSS